MFINRLIGSRGFVPAFSASLLLIVAVALPVQSAGATNFTSTGGTYDTNVAYRLDYAGNEINPVTESVSGGAVSLNSPKFINDYSEQSWQVSGLDTLGASASATIDLGQTFSLDKIHTDYSTGQPPSANLSYSLAVSTDDVHWTTVKAVTSTGGSPGLTDTFAATPARYVQWTVTNPTGGEVANGGPNGHAFLSELLAYVSTTSPISPQTDQGYNLMEMANHNTIVATVDDAQGFYDWGPASSMIDGSLSADGASAFNTTTATAVFNLGSAYMINRLQASFHNSWSTLEIDVSTDDTNWTTVVGPTTPLAAPFATLYSFSAIDAQYIRVIGGGAGGPALRELEAFLAPEPASLSLLAVGGLLILKRCRA